MTATANHGFRARLRAAAIRLVSSRRVQRTVTGLYHFYQFAAGLTVLAIIVGVVMLAYAWYRVSFI